MQADLEKNYRPGLDKRNLLYTLVDSMPDWIYIKDRESRFVLANKHLARTHGIDDPRQMSGKTDFDFYPEEYAREYYDDEQRIMASGDSMVNKEEVLIDPKGNTLVVSTTKIPVRDDSGEVVGIVGMGRDITPQKQAQKRLQELSMVASSTENVVVLMDREGNFTWVNKGFELRYGMNMEEFIALRGPNLRDNSSKEEIAEILDTVITSGKPCTYTSRTRDSRGGDAWYQTNITPVLDEEGKVYSMFLIDSDITSIKKADLQIKQQKYQLESQRDQLRNLNASKDRLFSIIAHDLKNPFQSIIGFSEILKEDFRALNMKQVEEYLDAIYSSSTTAYDLLYNLLEWARSQTSSVKTNPVALNIREACADIFELFSAQAAQKNIRIRNKVDREVHAMVDRNMFHTILRNLLANAVKYTGEGGSVTVSAIPSGDLVEISVSDTGIGMEEDKLKNLFSVEKGKSTPGTSGELGTGLGLLVCYEFLKLCKGKFEVRSKLGEGSTFTLSIPAAK